MKGERECGEVFLAGSQIFLEEKRPKIYGQPLNCEGRAPRLAAPHRSMPQAAKTLDDRRKKHGRFILELSSLIFILSPNCFMSYVMNSYSILNWT